MLDKFIEDDLPDLFYVEEKEDIQGSFDKDKAEFNCTNLSSSSSSP